MMLDHLNHHPKLYGFGIETYILPHYLAVEHRYGDLNDDNNFERLWKDMCAEYPFRMANGGQPVDPPEDWKAARRSATGVFDGILLEFARREGKDRWCEKTPAYALHITRLASEFPRSVFIHMVRDGRDCAASNHRRWGRHPVASMVRWKNLVRNCRSQNRLLSGRYLEVRYEDVTTDPEKAMREVCGFVGVDFDKRLLSSTRKRPFNVGQGSSKIVRNEGRYAKYFSDSKLRTLEKVGGKCLASLGYQTDHPEGDAEPSIFWRTCWTIHDAGRTGLRQIRNKLTVQRRMTWSLFVGRLKMIVRSKQTM
ncbi:hypothetical protein BH24PSE2_BH24PSE2_12870 [soil metagenome]